jgi:rubrerythrin
MYQEILKAVKAKQTIKDEPYYVCPVCGNTVAGNAPDVCPICATPGSKFKKIE